MATILAVSNRKGGTGKTTTAVNLAAEWGARGFRTLLVDLDPQGHAGIGFDVIARAGDPAAHHLFTRPGFRLAEAIRPSRFANVFVAPADRTFDGAAIERSPCALRRELIDGECAEAFDRIIIDTPPSLDMLLVNALAAADCLLAPLIPHSLSAEGVQQLTRLVRKVATSVNPNLDRIAMLPVMVNNRVSHQQDILQKLGARYGCERLLKGIRSDILLAEAFADHAPVREFAPRSRGALDYRQLAEDLTLLWAMPANASDANHRSS
jgi:chromosome partitioning protein